MGHSVGVSASAVHLAALRVVKQVAVEDSGLKLAALSSDYP